MSLNSGSSYETGNWFMIQIHANQIGLNPYARARTLSSDWLQSDEPRAQVHARLPVGGDGRIKSRVFCGRWGLPAETAVLGAWKRLKRPAPRLSSGGHLSTRPLRQRSRSWRTRSWEWTPRARFGLMHSASIQTLFFYCSAFDNKIY